MKHTKGPWKVCVAEPCGPNCDAADYAFRIETAIGRNTPIGSESLANTYLIAASPELLDACKQTKAYLDAYELSGKGDPCLMIDVLTRAIYKAEKQKGK